MENGTKQNEVYQIAEVEVSYRTKVKASERPRVRDSKDCCQMFLQKWDMDKIELLEQFYVMYLNRAHKVLAIYELASGGFNGVVADPRLMFTVALKIAASSIVVAHNHPSGNIRPSKADEDLTQKINEAGKFLDIKLIDHLIVTEERYFSFADEGLI